MFNIPNTAVTITGYRVAPNEGYVLHDKNLDTEVMDEETMMPTGEVRLGYRSYPLFCGVQPNYDFDNTKIMDGYTAYGNREFFARPASEVPADQIFGGVTPPVEIMGETEPNPEEETV